MRQTLEAPAQSPYNVRPLPIGPGRPSHMFHALIADTPWPEKSGSRTAIGPVPGSAGAACIAELAREERLLLVIPADTSPALSLERELPFFIDEGIEVLALPDWETLPYDNFSPHQDIVSERLHTFHRLPAMGRGVLIVPMPTLMHRLPPTEYVAGNSLVLETGQALVLDDFRRNLERNGYRNVETVYEHGEFALRGSLLDVFPMGSDLPYRIDLLDDEVDTLRTFDPETQRTVDRVDAINLLPAREFPLDRGAIQRFQMNWYETFESDPDSCPTYVEVCAGRVPGGCEYFLPLFFESCASLFDYLPDNTAVLTTGDHYQASQRFWDEVCERYTEYGIDPRRPLLPPARGFIPVEDLYASLGDYPVLELRSNPDAPVHKGTGLQPPPVLSSGEREGAAVEHLLEFIEEHQGPVLLCAESAGRREILLESLARQGAQPTVVASWQEFLELAPDFAIATAPIDRGLYAGPDAPTLVCEAQLFGTRVAQRRRRRRDEPTDSANVFRDLNELREGVPVVLVRVKGLAPRQGSRLIGPVIEPAGVAGAEHS